jgi:hypothetical protein
VDLSIGFLRNTPSWATSTQKRCSSPAICRPYAVAFVGYKVRSWLICRRSFVQIARSGVDFNQLHARF